ncbi:MAG: UvrD-helicase domain-containing protein, partial [Candidatus Poribacteria bacterium]|nr:UvrD-helicase domain-containing protein [Candidatus Poribacteria bacterium]
FCVGLLREHAPEIGLNKNFTIFDQETQEEVLIECLRELKLNRLDYPPWQLRDIIGAYKVKLQDPLTADGEMPEIRTRNGDVIDNPSVIQNFVDLIKAYQSKLAAHSALDFDDLLYKTVEVLEKTPAVRAKYHGDIRYILVDEYQDINAAQYELLRLLCRMPERNLMVVADENQSIYSWRGSMPEYIEKFSTDFQPTVVELEEHYRCTEKILRAAQTVIAKNTRQERSTLKTHRGAGHTLFHYTLGDPNEEASHIAKLIRQLVNDRHFSYGDIAIFYRTHQLAETLADRLYYEGIQFQRVGRENSFQETHAQDISSYLSFIQWRLPRDLERALNFPQSLIDGLTLARLKWLAQRDKLTLVDLLEKIEDYPEDVGPLTRRNICQFLEEINGFAEEIKGEKIGRIVSKLFNLLESRRLPYRDEEIHKIEESEEVPYLRLAADALYSAIQRGESVRITATDEIDARCAAHIVYQTIKRYLDCGVHIEFLPSEDDIPEIDETSINVLIGRFSALSEAAGTVILIASDPAGGANVIQLGIEEKPGNNPEIAKSVIALKLCQRVVGYFETPNFADMIVYDLETTDYNPKRAEIVEIAAKRLNIIGSEVERYHQYVKPSRAIPAASTRVHGIDNETVKDAPSIEAVLPGFLSFIQDRILVGHNVIEFDNIVLERDLRRLDIGLSNPCYDTLATAQRLYPRESCNLEALSEKFGIEHDTMHRAIEDIQVNHRVFEELVKVNLHHREVRSLTEFLPFVGIGILASQAER